MKRILITDEEFSDHNIEKEILRVELPGFEVSETNYKLDGISENILNETIGVLAQIYAPLDSNFLGKFPLLRGISVYGGGYDRVDLKYALKKGIRISRVPDYCNDEVSEFVIMSILMLSKKIDVLRGSFYGDAWGYEAIEKKLSEINNRRIGLNDLPKRASGKVLFILGYGKIGKVVAKKASALGMKVLYFDTLPQEGDGYSEQVSFVDGIRQADFVSIHAPLTEHTKGIFNYDAIKSMKRTSFIINTARGKLIIESDLIRALREGLIAGAALDVFENEPLPNSSELLRMGNVIATPHSIYATEESISSLKRLATENLIAIIKGREPEGLIRI
jgi:phosphoglycerate dehydrogenase-like enzyme